MSALCAPSPLTKRRFEEGEGGCGEHFASASPHSHSGHAVKRVRHLTPAAQQQLLQQQQQQLQQQHISHRQGGSGTRAVLAALQTLFPGMDEKTVSDVLTECGSNIDAAIKRLAELKLSAEAEAAAELVRAAGENVPGTPSSGQQHDRSASQSHEGVSTASPAASTTSSGPQTGEQWVEVLVQAMASARDLDEARGKAGVMLQQFESFLSSRYKEEEKVLASKTAILAKENGILKRAVQIQNAKLQEKVAGEGELVQLRSMLGQYQEQVRQLELNNYSLSLHLEKATSSNLMAGHHNPDVY